MLLVLKFLPGLVLLGFVTDLFIICAAESCTVNENCVLTGCDDGNTVICQHPNGTGITTDGGLCTCQSTTHLFIISAAETCTTNGDCSATNCAQGNTVVCQHPSGVSGVEQDGGLCTCNSTAACIIQSDCYGFGINLNCPDSLRHCYDNNCICDRFPAGR